MGFDAKYRPTTFEEVVGQDLPVLYLSRLLLSKARPRNILLYGAIGLGKTSLAKIYAQALNCPNRTRVGSPCKTCAACRRGADHLTECDVAREKPDASDIRNLIQQCSNTHVDLRYHTLFLDEAHALGERASDALLKSVEGSDGRIVYVFATTQIESMSDALLSRLPKLEVTPLLLGESIALLQGVADDEGIECEREALALLHGVKNGQARGMLVALEQLSRLSNGRVTRENVKEFFQLNHTDELVAYVVALASNDPGLQMAAFMRWTEPALEKLTWIHALFLSLYYRAVLARDDVTIDPILEALESHQTATIMSALRHRFEAAKNRHLAGPVEHIINLLAQRTSLRADAEVFLRMAVFHAAFNRIAQSGEQPQLGQVITNRELPSLPVERGSDAVAMIADTARHRSGAMISTGVERYLEAADVAKIIRYASFLGQEYGRTFNVAIEVEPDLVGVVAEIEAYEFVFSFVETCATLLAGDNGDHHYLCQFERDQSGFRARVLMSVTDSMSFNTDFVSKLKLEPGRFNALNLLDAVNFRQIAEREDARVKAHWDAVMDLCSGVSQESEIEGKPLIELLGIRKNHLRTPGPVRGPLHHASETLSDPRMCSAAIGKMDFLSAFDDRAWNDLKTGWELKEHIDRRKEKKRRADALAAAYHRSGELSNGSLELAQTLLANYPADPRERARTWTGWWMRGLV